MTRPLSSTRTVALSFLALGGGGEIILDPPEALVLPVLAKTVA